VPEVNLMGGVDPFLEAICPGFSPRNIMIEKPLDARNIMIVLNGNLR
jgi:hypothetical protein